MNSYEKMLGDATPTDAQRKLSSIIYDSQGTDRWRKFYIVTR